MSAAKWRGYNNTRLMAIKFAFKTKRRLNRFAIFHEPIKRHGLEG